MKSPSMALEPISTLKDAARTTARLLGELFLEELVSPRILAQARGEGTLEWPGRGIFQSVWVPWFGFLESPYERDCYLVVPLESQTTNPNQQLTISWLLFLKLEVRYTLDLPTQECWFNRHHQDDVHDSFLVVKSLYPAKFNIAPENDGWKTTLLLGR